LPGIQLISRRFNLTDTSAFKQKLLEWGSQFNSFLLLDNHGYPGRWNKLEMLAGIGSLATISAMAGEEAIAKLDAFSKQWKGYWLVGHLGYDLKNETEPGLFSQYENTIGFADLSFTLPQCMVQLGKNSAEIIVQDNSLDAESIFSDITSTEIKNHIEQHPCMQFAATHTRQSYLETVESIRQHIRRGDCYELNFCMHYHAQCIGVDPLALYHSLSARSPNPFGALYRQDDSWVVCASPERYILKVGSSIWSQPIKGTAPRGSEDSLDDYLRKSLAESKKDRVENVMVVDLVRNDLSRVCRRGSVQVEELFGIYAYPKVFQMISTIRGELDASKSFADIVRSTFPMGSMTGAPKRSVMQLTDAYEKAGRGLFSGALGYIDPSGDFDFNVIIRSILLNTQTGNVHYAVGGGITWQSKAESEWEECQLKASAIKAVFGITD